MHLFRSEGHVKNWSEFREGTGEAIIPLSDMMSIVGTPRHSARLSGHYVSSSAGYVPEFFATLKKVTGGRSFWDPKA